MNTLSKSRQVFKIFIGILCFSFPFLSYHCTTRTTGADPEILYQQYMVHGLRLYQEKCANCHQKNGTGLKRLIPPLIQTEYLQDLVKTACSIKNGLKGEIMVNGISYNQPMPAADLTDLEIAEIITYINNSWGNMGGLSRVNEVGKALARCP